MKEKIKIIKNVNEFDALDATDLRILDHLQRDASQSNQALAASVHTSAATCLRRVKRMVDAGVIEARVAIVSARHTGGALTAFAEVSLDRQGAEHIAAFEARAVAEAEVQQCYRVSPGPDLMLVLHLPDMPAYHALVQRLFTQDANVRNVKTFFSTHRSKFETRVPLQSPKRATSRS